MALRLELSNLSATEKLEHIKELTKIRQQRYYKKNKTAILEKKRLNTATLKEAVKTAKNPNIQLIITEDEEPEVLTPISITLEQMLEMIDNLPLETAGNKKYYSQQIKTISELQNCDDIIECFNRPNLINDIIYMRQKSNPNKTYSINSVKGYYQTILKLIDAFKLPVKKDTYEYALNNYKILSSNQDKENNEQVVISYPEYLSKIKDNFGDMSKQYVLASLYNEVTVRDNYHHLKIVSKEEPRINQLIINNNKTYSIILNEFKTKGKYEKIQVALSTNLTKLLKQYMAKEKIAIDDYLFGISKLSGFISKMNLEIGLVGSINLLRHIKITTELNNENINDAKIRTDLYKIMGHSLVTQLNYLRKMKII